MGITVDGFQAYFDKVKRLATRRRLIWAIFGWTYVFLGFVVYGQEFDFSLEIANPNPVGSGARALGKGNAFIAVADDATAASWNPAGLLQLELPEVSFAIEAISQSLGVNSDSHPESEGHDAFNFGDFNYASLVFPFHLGTNMVISINYLKLFRFDKEMNFPVQIFESLEQQTIRTNLVYDFDQKGSFSVIAPAFGIDITNDLSMGVTLNIWNHDLTQSSRFKKTEITTGEIISTGDINRTDLGNFKEVNELKVEEGYSVVIGGLYRVNEDWNIGFVVKPEFDLDLEHDITIDNSKQTRGAELDMPMILGGGIAWRPIDPFTLSMDVTWTDWSDYQFVDKTINSVKNPLTGRSPKVDELEDTFTVRMGGEYLFVNSATIRPLRFGLGYDPAPAVDEVDDFYTISVGTGLQSGRYNFDIAYEFRWGNNVNGISLEALNATQDVRRHRLLASLIYYF